MPGINIVDVQVLLLELQPEIVASVQTPAPETLHRAATAVRSIATALGIPLTVSVFQVGDREPALIDELGGLAPMPRAAISAFADGAIRTRLEGHDRKVLAVGGVSTEIAVFHAVLDARRLGYEVHVLADCCGGLSDRTDAAARRSMELAGARPSNVSSFFTSLVDGGPFAARGVVMAALAKLWTWPEAADDAPRFGRLRA